MAITTITMQEAPPHPSPPPPTFEWEVCVLYLELYGEEICDLLSNDTGAGRNLQIRDGASATKGREQTSRKWWVPQKFR